MDSDRPNTGEWGHSHRVLCLYKNREVPENPVPVFPGVRAEDRRPRWNGAQERGSPSRVDTNGRGSRTDVWWEVERSWKERNVGGFIECEGEVFSRKTSVS